MLKAYRCLFSSHHAIHACMLCTHGGHMQHAAAHLAVCKEVSWPDQSLTGGVPLQANAGLYKGLCDPERQREEDQQLARLCVHVNRHEAAAGAECHHANAIPNHPFICRLDM